jgi:hypothetical protein
MQACQVCGATAVDAGGYCASCQSYRGPRSYALSPPAADLPATGVAAAPRSDPGAVYYSTAGLAHHASVASYPVSPSGPAYPQAGPAVEERIPAQQTRSPLTTPLFLLTVMVVVLVAGTVSVVLIKSKDRGNQPTAAGQTSPAAPVAAAASGAPASATPAASAVVDRCVVGEWAVTSWSVRYGATDLTTDAGGMFRLRAEGVGTWDFGSGVTLTGKVDGVKSEDLVTGRVDFAFRTAGLSFSFQDLRSDVREVLTQGDEDPVNRQIAFRLSVAEYTCAGDAFRLKVDGYDIQMGRK